MPSTVENLATIITTIENAPWNHALYLDAKRPWNQATRCAILDPNDVNDSDADEDPEFALRNRLCYALTVADVQDIVSNTRQQRTHATVEDMIRAINYYYDHDAYIKW